MTEGEHAGHGQTVKNRPAGRGRAGKYLTFRLATEEYGLEILKVREIIRLIDVTRVPRTPHFVRGVINLRGKVIPVVDLRLRFGMEKVQDTEKSCIVVVDVDRNGNAVQIGILVDTVSEVLAISEADIEDSPWFGLAFDSEFILGIAKMKGAVKILLNVEKVLTSGELSEIGNMASREPVPATPQAA